MPGAVPYTSTMALTNVTLTYILKIANLGWEQACNSDESLSKGLNIVKGDIVYKELEGIFD
jgi:alanine dehydrogenase